MDKKNSNEESKKDFPSAFQLPNSNIHLKKILKIIETLPLEVRLQILENAEKSVQKELEAQERPSSPRPK